MYACLKKFYVCFNCFDIKQRIAQTNKNYTSWTSQLIRSTTFLFDVCRVNETKFTGT